MNKGSGPSSCNVLFIIDKFISIFYSECAEWLPRQLWIISLWSCAPFSLGLWFQLSYLCGLSDAKLQCMDLVYHFARLKYVLVLIPYFWYLICLTMHNENLWMPTSNIFFCAHGKILKHQRNVFLCCFSGSFDLFQLEKIFVLMPESEKSQFLRIYAV